MKELLCNKPRITIMCNLSYELSVNGEDTSAAAPMLTRQVMETYLTQEGKIHPFSTTNYIEAISSFALRSLQSPL